jgi:hypothetical protein
MKRSTKLGVTAVIAVMLAVALIVMATRAPEPLPDLAPGRPGLSILPAGSMWARIDSVRIYSVDNPDASVMLPTEPGDTIALDAVVYWKLGQAPAVYSLVWNLKACVEAQEAECRSQLRSVELEHYTGVLRIVRPLEHPERLSVSLGIAVGTRATDGRTSL